MQCLKCGNEFDPDLFDCPVCAEVKKQSGVVNRMVSAAEDILTVACLGIMVMMVLLQIVMRNFFHTGILGGDDLVRHLVLWIAFFGAGAATRGSAHVKMDVLTNFIPARWLKYSEAAVNLFSCAISGILVYASVQFIRIEYQARGHSPFLHLPVWIMEIILPLGYFLLSCRFAHNCISRIMNIIRG